MRLWLVLLIISVCSPPEILMTKISYCNYFRLMIACKTKTINLFFYWNGQFIFLKSRIWGNVLGFTISLNWHYRLLYIIFPSLPCSLILSEFFGITDLQLSGLPSVTNSTLKHLLSFR